MSWRPDSWDEIRDENYSCSDFMDGFEAGASALLTFLLSSGIISISQLEELDKSGDNEGNIK